MRARTNCEYEWLVEITTTRDTPAHAAGEVMDHYYATSYADAARFAAEAPDPGYAHVIVLVRDTAAGRAWAYLSGGQLPDAFRAADDRVVGQVPTRFRREVARV